MQIHKMGLLIDKSLILNKIKSHYNFKSDADFARFLGIKPNTLSNWYTRNTIDYERVIILCEDIDANWLITGKGNMLKGQSNKRARVREPTCECALRTNKRGERQQIPLYSLEAATELEQLLNNKQPVKEYISIPNLPKCDGAVYITGDSMFPLLQSGDIIMYKKLNDIINGILYGEMYLLTFEIVGDTYTVVKWLQRSDRGSNYIKLVSENQRYQSKDIPLKSIKAIAYVKASIRINSVT